MKAATEFVGTFLFLLVIALVAPSGSPLTPVAIGGGLMALVYMGGHRSGAHYNPAVSLALFVQRKITAAELGAYVVAQIGAGVVAFLLGASISGKVATVAPPNGVSFVTPFFIEALFTAMLVLVILNAAASKRTEGNSFYGLAIGITIVAAAIAGGPISGGSFNPAVAIGSAVVSGRYDVLVVTAIGPLVGAVAGSYFWAWQEASDPVPVVGPAGQALDQPATGHPVRE